jgi:hypothetical protein
MCRAEHSAIKIDFSHSKNICFCFFDGCPNLLMLVALGIDWEALNVQEGEPKCRIWLGCGGGITPPI